MYIIISKEVIAIGKAARMGDAKKVTDDLYVLCEEIKSIKGMVKDTEQGKIEQLIRRIEMRNNPLRARIGEEESVSKDELWRTYKIIAQAVGQTVLVDLVKVKQSLREDVGKLEKEAASG